MKFYIGILLLTFVAQSVFSHEGKWDWVKKSTGKNSNEVVWNLKNNDFLKSEVAAFQEDFGFKKKNKKMNLDEALLTVLGGPPDETVATDENSLFISACRHQSCDEKGFYWVNAKDKASVMGILHYFYQGKIDKDAQLFLASKNYKCDQYPEAIKYQVKIWLGFKNVNPKVVRCLQDGKVTEVKL